MLGQSETSFNERGSGRAMNEKLLLYLDRGRRMPVLPY